MLQHFLATCSTLFSKEDKLLLAVSGGRDSVVLEHLCHKAGYNYEIAHCNFHLRGDLSNRDEQFVRRLAEQRDVPIHVAQFDTTAYAAQQHLSTEEAARNLRYNFFYHTLDEHRLNYIVTAHHLDDTIETFFINLMRGTGIAGLRGIPQKNNRVVRPLLEFSRDEINHYVEKEHLDFVEDHTNAELLYRRNQVRHQLLPTLRKIAPAFDKTMRTTLQHLAEVEQVYHTEIQTLKKTITHINGEQLYIDIDGLKESVIPISTALFEILKDYGFLSAQVADIVGAIENQSGKQFLSPTHCLVKDRDNFILSPREMKSSSIEDYTLRCEIVKPLLDISQYRKLTSDTTAYFDADKVHQPLTLRCWHEGDRFSPFGMKGTQLVSDYLTDHKIPLPDKKRLQILIDDDGQILWLVGHRTSEKARITPATKTVLKVEIKPLSNY